MPGRSCATASDSLAAGSGDRGESSDTSTSSASSSLALERREARVVERSRARVVRHVVAQRPARLDRADAAPQLACSRAA